jgi:hypothetical protein
MADITSALIGGGFSIVGIYLKHVLEVRQKAKSERAKAEITGSASPIPPAVEVKSKSSEPRLAENAPPTPTPIEREPQIPYPPPLPARLSAPTKRKSHRIAKGVVILIADLVVIAVFVSAFDLNNTEPPWESYFAFVTIGAVPVYALYLVFSGISRSMRGKLRRKVV